MEFIKANFLDTTTQLTLDSNTVGGKNLFASDNTFQYISDGFNDDLTITSIVVSFAETLTVGRISLEGMNIKEFDIFNNGVTANAFAITSTGSTSTTLFTSNSETALYMEVTPVACTSVTFDLKATIVADQEKAIGRMRISANEFTFERLPAAKNYKPQLITKEIIHKMSDGGNRIHALDDKWSFEVKYKHIDASFRDGLKLVYDQKRSFIFVAFGTMTGWDEVIADVVWTGPFNFFRFSDDAVDAGFSGSIKLKETTE